MIKDKNKIWQKLFQQFFGSYREAFGSIIRQKMNLLSKPYKFTLQLMGAYFSQLYMHPIRTKSITSCLTLGLANCISQQMSGAKLLNHDTFWAFAVFGLLFGGPIPHYFYEALSSIFPKNSTGSLLQMLLIKRLFFTPVYLFFTMYVLSRLEGKDHQLSLDAAFVKFPSVFRANLKYLSLLHFINMFFVPPVLRVLVENIITFLWIIYFSRARQEEK